MIVGMDFKKYFEGKKVTVQGLGLLGRGLGDIEFLAKNGADLIVTDLKTEAELKKSLDKLKNYPNIKYILGEHRPEDFRGRDFILRAPNAPLDSPYLEEAKKNGVPIEMSASLFAKLAGVPIIGITGTRGKSTTTYLTYEILKRAYQEGLNSADLDSGRVGQGGVGRTGKPVLGGNVQGVSNLSLLNEIKDGDLAVLELDSWQLQGFGESEISPHIAVFTNFMPDHLNYYKGSPKNPRSFRASMDRYFADKANIFKYQTEKDFLVAGKDVSQKIPQDVKSKVLVAGDKTKDWPAKLIGDHNRELIELAVLATSCVGVSEDIQKKAVAEFSAVPGRLEFVTEKKGIKFYNDTNSTVPEAVIVALKALKKMLKLDRSRSEGGNIILISGGTDKELNYAEYAKVVPDLAKKIILLPGTGTEKIKKEFADSVEFSEAQSMEEAFKLSLDNAQPGDIVLLSPGATSFGLFKNEYDRGDQFVELIKKL